MSLWMLAVMLPPFLMCWYNGIYVAENRYNSDEEQDVLCSCEYTKSEEDGGGKGHLLDCMDDYQRLDECGQASSWTGREASQLLHTLEDHCVRRASFRKSPSPNTKEKMASGSDMRGGGANQPKP